MSLSVTYTFSNGTTADGSQVNQNFTDIANYVNTNAILKDASVAFTAVPSGPASDPTTANQLTRKSYVDTKAAALDTAHATNVYQSNGISFGVSTLETTIASVTVPAQSYACLVTVAANCMVQFNHGFEIQLHINVHGGSTLGGTRLFIAANSGLGYVIKNPLFVEGQADSLPVSTARTYDMTLVNFGGGVTNTFADSRYNFIKATVHPQ